MVSVMETNIDDVSQTQAAEALESLAADRDRLAQRIRVPWTLMIAFGAMGAWWVGSAATAQPGAHYQPPESGWFAIVGVLIILYLLHRDTGISFRTAGARATWALIGVIVGCLVLFSVSLALVSLDLRWAVALTALAAFALTTWLASVAFRCAVENLRHARS